MIFLLPVFLSLLLQLSIDPDSLGFSFENRSLVRLYVQVCSAYYPPLSIPEGLACRVNTIPTGDYHIPILIDFT